uniref:Uncharacterized protein n=1 Tax=Arundo donax TaxID=35708 RepID=A0A0A8YH90_ARUDO
MWRCFWQMFCSIRMFWLYQMSTGFLLLPVHFSIFCAIKTCTSNVYSSRYHRITTC